MATDGDVALDDLVAMVDTAVETPAAKTEPTHSGGNRRGVETPVTPKNDRVHFTEDVIFLRAGRRCVAWNRHSGEQLMLYEAENMTSSVSDMLANEDYNLFCTYSFTPLSGTTPKVLGPQPASPTETLCNHVVFNAKNGRGVRSFLTKNLCCMVMDEENNRIFAGVRDQMSMLEISTRHDKVLDTIHYEGRTDQPDWCDQLRYLALSDDSIFAIGTLGSIHCWDRRTLLPKWSNLGDCGEDGADDAFFYQSSQGGRLILTDCNDKYHVLVYDAETGTLLNRIGGTANWDGKGTPALDLYSIVAYRDCVYLSCTRKGHELMVVNIHDSSIVFDGAFEDLDVVLPMGDWMYCTKGETNVETVNIVTGERGAPIKVGDVEGVLAIPGASASDDGDEYYAENADYIFVDTDYLYILSSFQRLWKVPLLGVEHEGAVDPEDPAANYQIFETTVGDKIGAFAIDEEAGEVIAAQKNFIKIFGLEDGNVREEWLAHKNNVSEVYLWEGHIVSVDGFAAIKFWNRHDNSFVKKIPGSMEKVVFVEHNGRKLMVCNDDYERVECYDLSNFLTDDGWTKEANRLWSREHEAQSPDNFPVVWKHGELAMVGAMFDRSAYAYMLESGDEVGVFPQDVTWDTDDGEAWGAGDEIFCHGKYVITTAKRTRLWDVESNEMLGVVDVPYGVTPEILMTDDFFLVGDTNRLQKFTYDNVEQAALDFEVLRVGDLHELTVKKMHIHDGFLYVQTNERVRTYSLEDGSASTVFDDHYDPLTQIALTSDGTRLLSASTKIVWRNLTIWRRLNVIAKFDFVKKSAVDLVMKKKLPVLLFIADVLVLLVTFFQFASFAFSQNWADAGYVQPVQKSSEKVLDLGLGTVTISPVVPFIGAMVLTMIFMASFFVQEEVEAGKFLNPSANKWKFTWLFMTFAIKIMATMLFVPIFGIFAEFSTRCEGGYLGVSLPPGGFAFINNISDSGSREAVLEDAFECFGGVHWFFIIVSVPFAFFYLLFSLRFFRAGSELDNIEFYLNIFNWSDDVDKVPERVHALSPSRHAHYYALGGVFAKIVLTIGSFVLATGVGQGSGSGDDADADAGSNKFILYNLTQIFVGMVLLIIAAVRLPFAVGKSNAIRWAIDVGILWTYCCSTAATLVRKQAPQYTLVILVVLPIFLIIFPIIGFVIMSKIVGCRRRRRKARDAVMIGAGASTDKVPAWEPPLGFAGEHCRDIMPPEIRDNLGEDQSDSDADDDDDESSGKGAGAGAKDDDDDDSWGLGGGDDKDDDDDDSWGLGGDDKDDDDDDSWGLGGDDKPATDAAPADPELDALLAGLDTPAPATDAAPADPELDALLAGLDTPSPAPAADDPPMDPELAALLAGLDEPAAPAAAPDAQAEPSDDDDDW